MACLEIVCIECDFVDFTNHRIERCPKCGGRVRVFFDEDPEPRDYGGERGDDGDEE